MAPPLRAALVATGVMLAPAVPLYGWALRGARRSAAAEVAIGEESPAPVETR